jgi:Tfp pilus assembly protein PilN
MTSLRVNLIRSEERRYQGPVSKRFILLSLGGALAAGLFIWAGVGWTQRAETQKELTALESEWALIQPRYNLAKAKAAQIGQIEEVEKELKLWGATRLQSDKMLEEFASTVPENIQIVRLSIFSEWSVVRPPAPPPPPENTETRPKPPPPGIPARKSAMSISGRAAGDDGSDAVVKMVQDLKAAPVLGSVLETIKLNNLLRDVQPDDQSDRSFTIDAPGKLRKLQ